MPQNCYRSLGRFKRGRARDLVGARCAPIRRSEALIAGGAAPDAAFVGGLQWAFVVGALFGVAVIALSVFLPTKADQPASMH